MKTSELLLLCFFTGTVFGFGFTRIADRAGHSSDKPFYRRIIYLTVTNTVERLVIPSGAGFFYTNWTATNLIIELK